MHYRRPTPYSFQYSGLRGSRPLLLRVWRPGAPEYRRSLAIRSPGAQKPGNHQETKIARVENEEKTNGNTRETQKKQGRQGTVDQTL